MTNGHGAGRFQENTCEKGTECRNNSKGKARFRRNTSDKTAPVVQHIMNVNDEVWTVQQLARMLNLSVAAVQKRIQRGTIPAHKQGKYWYILKSEYIAYIKKQ